MSLMILHRGIIGGVLIVIAIRNEEMISVNVEVVTSHIQIQYSPCGRYSVFIAEWQYK